MSQLEWDDARIFLSVAEQGSFSAAAVHLGVGQATVSRRIAQIEEQLGGALFSRGRRGTTLSPLGKRMLPAAQQMSRWAAELQAIVASEEQEVSGRVTLASPAGVAYDFLVPFAAKFARQQAAITLELRVGVDYLDLTRGEADIALRGRESTDPALMTLAHVKMPVRAFASRRYLETLETPPAHVKDMNWISWGRSHAHLPARALLSKMIDNFEPVFAADEIILQIKACEAGMGAMLLPATRHMLIAARQLEEVPCGLPTMDGEVFVVCARSMRHVPRVHAVLESLLAELALLEAM